MLTVRQLEIFVEVVRAGSFRRCAARLDVSPISIGDHIRSLEEALEVRLFERKPGGPVALTGAGSLALEHAKHILAEVCEMHRRIKPSRGRSPKVLHVHVQPFTAVRARPILQQHAAELGIELDLDLSYHSPEDVVDKLEDGALDVSIMLSASWREGHGILLHRIENSLFVGDQHPLLKKPEVGREDIAGLTYLALPSGTHSRMIVDEVLARARIPVGKVGLESDDLGSMLGALGANEGFMVGPSNFIQHFGVNFPIRALALDFELPSLESRLLCRPRDREQGAIADLVGWVLDTFGVRVPAHY